MRSTKGFSLIELLIVVAIILIIAAIAIPNLAASAAWPPMNRLLRDRCTALTERRNHLLQHLPDRRLRH